MKITKDTTIGELIKELPESVHVLQKQGMHCIGCHVAVWETIEQAAEVHGINSDSLLRKLREVQDAEDNV